MTQQFDRILALVGDCYSNLQLLKVGNGCRSCKVPSQLLREPQEKALIPLDVILTFDVADAAEAARKRMNGACTKERI